jgi:gas vesicle protein
MKALPGIIVGLAAGALLGLLLAPQSGKKTRRMFGEESDSFFSDLQDQLQSGLDKIRDQYNDHVEMGVEKAKETVDMAKRKAKF